MPLRPTTFFLPSSSEIRIFFSHHLDELSKNNFLIKSTLTDSQDLRVISVSVEKNYVTIKTSPQNPRTYYTITLLDDETYQFKALDGTRLINDKGSRKIFFIGQEEYNPIRDRMYASIPKIYDLNGTLIDDILSVQSKLLHDTQRAVGELLSDNYIRVPIVDELRTRSSGAYDLFSNENVFKIKKVSKNITGFNKKFKTLNYTDSNTNPRHNKVEDIISLQEDTLSETIILGKENFVGKTILLNFNENIIKLLSIKWIKNNEQADCDGNIGTFYDINKYRYLIKEDRYDRLSKQYLLIDENQIVIPEWTNISDAKFGDKFEISYLTKTTYISPDEEVDAYEIIEDFVESTPINSSVFYLSNPNIVNSNFQIPTHGGVNFFIDENSSEIPQEFKVEIKNSERLPKFPGEYSVDYNTGKVTVYGSDGAGTSQSSYIARYSYKRNLETNYDYYVNDKEFVLNKNREIINGKIFIDYFYEEIFQEGIDYENKSHIEVLGEEVLGKNVSGFSIKTKRGPVTDIFKIINNTTGEIYNPLFSHENKIFFSGNRSPEIKESLNNLSEFNSVFQERLIETFITICPAFYCSILSAPNPSNVKISPPIRRSLIDSASTDYYIRLRDNSKEYRIKFFGTGDFIEYVGLYGNELPPSNTPCYIGNRMSVIDLDNSEIISDRKDSIGSIFSNSIEFSNNEIFKREKYFDLESKIKYFSNNGLNLISSLSSDNSRDNFQRLKKVGDYLVDYKNGVIYVATSSEDNIIFGNANYLYNRIVSSNEGVVSITNIYKSNPKTQNIYKYEDQYFDNSGFSIKNIEKSYEKNDNSFASYKNIERETCIILDDYTVLVSKDIANIYGIFFTDDIYGKNVYSGNNFVDEISSDNIKSRNILNNISVMTDQNRIDLKQSEFSYAKKDSSNFVLNIAKATSNIFDIVEVSSGNTICDSNLIHKKDEIFYSKVQSSESTFTLSVINSDIFDSIETNDFVLDENNRKYNIISHTIVGKSITLNGTRSGERFILSTKGVIDSKKIKFSLKSKLKNNYQYKIRYINSFVPNIGKAVLVDYSVGNIYYDYLYLKDKIKIFYEYGHNAIDWSINNSLNEGDNYYVSYEYGALRNALANNFSKLVQLPYFLNFGPDKDRESFRDALEGALQSFAKGPTIPSIKQLVKSISKTEPEVVEQNVGGWILSTSHLETKNNYLGNLSYEAVKYSEGLLFTQGIGFDIPAISNVQVREGSLSTWFKPKWGGIENDAELNVSIDNINKYLFRYDTKENYLNNEFFILNFKNICGMVDDTEHIRIANSKDKISNFGIQKEIKSLLPMDKVSCNFQIKNKIDYLTNFYSNEITNIGEVVFNDGIRMAILETKICKIKNLNSTITEPEFDKFFIEKKYLYTEVTGNKNEFFNIYKNTIKIELFTPIKISDFSSFSYENLNNKNLFILNSNGYIYRIKGFLTSDGVSESFSEDISEIYLDFLPINFDLNHDYENISSFSIGNDISLFCTSLSIVKESNQSSLINEYKNNFIIDFEELNNISYESDSLNNSIIIKYKTLTSKVLYSDIYLTDNISSYFSFENDDIIELKKKKGFGLLISNSNIDIEFYLSKDFTYKLDRYFTNKNIFIGKKGFNPKTSNFKLSSKTRNIDGVYESEKPGIYIGLSESYVDEELVPTKHWLTKVYIPKTFLLPQNISSLNGSYITNFNYYTVEVYFSGKIKADGEFSLVSEI